MYINRGSRSVVSVVSSRSTHMAEPVCSLCAKQLLDKKERILLRGQSKEAALCENALSAYLREKHPHQDLEEILGSSSVSRQYICHTCSSLVRKWHTTHTNQLKLEAEIQGTTMLHTRMSATHLIRGHSRSKCSFRAITGCIKSHTYPTTHPPTTS